MSESEIDLPEYWPRIGERLFIPGSPGRDAELSASFDERMYRMKAAFKSAADLMVEHTKRIRARGTIWFGRSSSATDSILNSPLKMLLGRTEIKLSRRLARPGISTALQTSGPIARAL